MNQAILYWFEIKKANTVSLYNCRRPPIVQKPLEIDDNFLSTSNYKTFIFQAKNAIIITEK